MKRILFSLIIVFKKLLKKYFNSEDPNFPYYLIIAIASIIFAISIKIFYELAEGLTKDEFLVFDKTVTNFLIKIRTKNLTTFFLFITNLGDRLAYFILITIISLYLYFKNNLKIAFQIVFVLLLSSIANLLLKRAINRQRPFEEHLVFVDSLSFPSGHAMSAMAFYGFIIYLFLKFVSSVWAKIILIAICISMILLIGISRIYLGVHFPSDVVAGYIGGLVWLNFCVIVFNLLSLYRLNNKTGNEVHN